MADKKISALTAASAPLAGTEVLPIVQGGATVKVAVSDLTAGRLTSAVNFANGYTAVVSAGGTTTMTSASTFAQKLSGTLNQTFKLPDATTVSAGIAYLFDNDSTGTLTVVDNASGAVTTVAAGSAQYVFLETAGTAAGSWGKYMWIAANGAFPGDLTMSTGNIVQGTAAKGFDFSANSTAAGKTSTLLNWYEEGNWTPVITLGGATTGITYSSQIGKYTRIGRQVVATIFIALSSKGSATGTMRITGVPYTPGTNGNVCAAITVDNCSFSAGASAAATLAAGSSSIVPSQVLNGVAFTMSDTLLTNTSVFYLTFTFFV